MRLINVDALMEECAKFVAPSNNSDFAEVPTWNDAISLIGSAPTIEERKTGKWIKAKSSLWSVGKCSVCGAISVDADTANYCKNCGARMNEGREQ